MTIKIPPERLSKSQIQIANLAIDRNYLVTGAPGTGKTLLALLRAKKIMDQFQRNQRRKPKILFIVFNRPLQNYLKMAIKQIGLQPNQAKTYHSWLFSDIYRGLFQKDVSQVQDAPQRYVWDLVRKDFKSHGKPILDHVILDEAHDLPKELVEIINNISDNITIFLDDNQKISNKRGLLTRQDAMGLIGGIHIVFFILLKIIGIPKLLWTSHNYF